MTSSDHHGLPTPRSTLRDSSARVLFWCKVCQHHAEADLEKLSPRAGERAADPSRRGCR
jgi:hypothetical protein